MLTPKQQTFVEEYLKDLNATQAAIRAGYSPKSAYSTGERLLRNAEVEAAVKQGKRERSERTKVDADYVLTRLHDIDQQRIHRNERFAARLQGQHEVLDLVDAGHVRAVADSLTGPCQGE